MSGTGPGVRRLELRHAGGISSVWVGAGAVDELVASGRDLLAGRRVFAISSEPLLALHGATLATLAAECVELTILEVPDGEAAKTVAVAESLWRRLLLAGGKRDALIVAFGGGAVGDVAGFVAGCFLRGVDVVQIPTTLLAQVDAAIGGKTAINLPEAKNSVGAFHHPLMTISDTRFLGTLPARQLRSGLFEVVKTAAMLDAGLLDALESDFDLVAAADPEALTPIVARTAAAKIAIVEKDPEEADERRLLNFGHTLGHALEMTSGVLEHGEAVGYGMLFALQLAVERGLARPDAERIETFIRRLGLPRLPRSLDADEVFEHLLRDKKAREAGLSWVVPAALGRGIVVDDVPLGLVRERLPRFVAADC